MVVPTMLGRILDVLERDGEQLPQLRHLSYGGGRMPVAGDRAGAAPAAPRRLRQRLRAHRDQLDDRRARARGPPGGAGERRPGGAPPARLGRAAAADARGRDPRRRRRAGRRRCRPARSACAASRSPASTSGATTSSSDGWFPTSDAGSLDEDGYLYLEGRLDDVIVRGAENLSPGEIEDVLVAHPAVADAAVVGVPDTEWGEKVVAAVVAVEGERPSEAELQAWVKDRLRSSKVPTARVRVRGAAVQRHRQAAAPRAARRADGTVRIVNGVGR